MYPVSGSGNGPSGNRTRVLGSEAQEDILYPMDPSLYLSRKLLRVFSNDAFGT